VVRHAAGRRRIRPCLDVLPDRESDTFAAWFTTHPGTEIICRDRATAYSKATKEAAPGALEVADRWHNFVTMHSCANSPVMRHIENQVRAAVMKGEIIQYSMTPVYDGANKIPLGMWVEAHGNNGFQPTEHKSTGNTEPTNSAFILNKKRGT
jgi:hypothetical protein